MNTKMIFSFLIAIALFSCSDDELENQQLTGTWIEQSPIVNRTKLVFEPENVVELILQNPERELSYTIVGIKKDSIELSDNLADMNNSLKLYFKVIDNKKIMMENLYSDENEILTFKKQ